MSMTELTVPALEEKPLPPMTIAQSIYAVLAGLGAQFIAAIVLLLRPLLGEETITLLGYGLSMGLAVFFACRIRGLPTERASFDLRVPRASTWLPLALGSIGLMVGVASPIASLMPLSEGFRKWLAEAGSETGFATLLAFVVAAPVLEELLFRGVILDGLLRKYSARTAILVSSVLFGFMHLNPVQLVTGTIFGAFAGWVYFRSRSLLACILIHMATNGTGYLARLSVDETKPIDVSASLVESYGGLVPLVGIIAGSVLVAVLSIWALRRQWRGRPVSRWPSSERRRSTSSRARLQT